MPWPDAIWCPAALATPHLLNWWDARHGLRAVKVASKDHAVYVRAHVTWPNSVWCSAPLTAPVLLIIRRCALSKNNTLDI